MSRIRAVVTMPFTTALPSDVAVNTFHFVTTSSPPTTGEIDEVTNNLVAFYNSDFGAAGNPLSSYISSLVSRVAGACTVEQFDLADPEPRQPISSVSWQMGAAGGTQQLPPEVAMCASFNAAPISGIPQARRRGRVYVGPLMASAMTATTSRPITGFLEATRDAMEGIFDLFAGSGVVWSVYSRVGDAMAAVVGGFVDDEFDTMRSRQRLRTTRLLWTG